MSQAAPEAAVAEPVVLCRINRLYRSDLSAVELEEATRGFWRLGKKLPEKVRAARFAFAVYRGVICEVYRIDSWHEAGTLAYLSRDPGPYRGQGRWEFSGAVATDLRDRYIGRSVRRHFKPGERSPIKFLNC